MSRTIAFCDPGLDRVSVAIFRYQLGPRLMWTYAPMQEKLRQLDRVHVVTTPSTDPLPCRLLTIARGVRDILVATKAERFYMETPRFSGTYDERSDRETGRRGVPVNALAMIKTHHASGAIIAAAMTVIPCGVEMVKSLPGGKGNSKADRLERVRMLLVSIGRREEIRNADDLDAVALGLASTWPG